MRDRAVSALALIALLAPVLVGCSEVPCQASEGASFKALREVWPDHVPISRYASDACGDDLDGAAAYSPEPLTAAQISMVLEEMAGSEWHDEGPALLPGTRYWSADVDGRSFVAYLTQTDSSTDFEIDTP
jgi:hypothetical protein